MKEPCPDPEAWIPRLGSEELPPEILAHLAACPECREDARAVLGDPPRRAWLPRAAAAALLAAAGTFWLLREHPPAPVPNPAPPASPVPVREDLNFDRGHRWIRAERPVALQTPLGRLDILRGQAGAILEEEGTRSASILRDAWAAEGVVLRLVLLEGSEAAFRDSRWTGPCRVRIGAEGARQDPLDEPALAEALAWRDEADGAGAWKDLGAAPVGVPRPEARDLLFPVPDGVRALVLEAEIREPAGSQTAFCFPVGGGTASTSLDSGGGDWRVVRLRLDPSRLEILSGTRILLSAVPPREPSGISARRELGFRVWQGPVEVRRLRWRPLR